MKPTVIDIPPELAKGKIIGDLIQWNGVPVVFTGQNRAIINGPVHVNAGYRPGQTSIRTSQSPSWRNFTGDPTGFMDYELVEQGAFVPNNAKDAMARKSRVLVTKQLAEELSKKITGGEVDGAPTMPGCFAGFKIEPTLPGDGYRALFWDKDKSPCPAVAEVVRRVKDKMAGRVPPPMYVNKKYVSVNQGNAVYSVDGVNAVRTELGFGQPTYKGIPKRVPRLDAP